MVDLAHPPLDIEEDIKCLFSQLFIDAVTVRGVEESLPARQPMDLAPVLEETTVLVHLVGQGEDWVCQGASVDPVGAQLHQGGPEGVGEHAAAPSKVLIFRDTQNCIADTYAVCLHFTAAQFRYVIVR